MAAVIDPWTKLSPDSSSPLFTIPKRNLSDWEGVTTADLYRQVEDKLGIWEEIGGFDRRQPPLLHVKDMLEGLDEYRFNASLSRYMNQNGGKLNLDNYLAQLVEYYVDDAGKLAGGIPRGQIIHDGFCKSLNGKTYRVFGVVKFNQYGRVQREWRDRKFVPNTGFIAFETGFDGAYLPVNDMNEIEGMQKAVYENLLNIGKTRRVIVRHYGNITEAQEQVMLGTKELLSPDMYWATNRTPGKKEPIKLSSVMDRKRTQRWLVEDEGIRTEEVGNDKWLWSSNPSHPNVAQDSPQVRGKESNKSKNRVKGRRFRR